MLIEEIIGHVYVQSCLLIMFQYWPISLQSFQLSVERPIRFGLSAVWASLGISTTEEDNSNINMPDCLPTWCVHVNPLVGVSIWSHFSFLFSWSSVLSCCGACCWSDMSLNSRHRVILKSWCTNKLLHKLAISSFIGGNWVICGPHIINVNQMPSKEKP